MKLVKSKFYLSDLQVGPNDWMSSARVDFLNDFVNNDCKVLYHYAQYPNEQRNTLTSSSSSVLDSYKIHPGSPANSYDSGIGSPGSDVSSSLAGSFSPSKDALSCCDGPPQLEKTVLYDQKLPVFSFQVSPEIESLQHSSVEGEITRNVEIDVSGIPESITNQTISHSTAPSIDFTAEASQLTIDDVTAIIDASTSEYIATSSKMSPPDYTTASLSPASTIAPSSPEYSPPFIQTSSPRSRCGRKSKVTSIAEKKQRKRDQNKNAATRYRERKRQQAQDRDAEFSVLNSRNKELKDKISQISKEMDYLRELMIEVYKIKGLIS